MKIHLWTIIPAIIFLTFLYLQLGISGYWNYSYDDFLYGNAIVSLGIGCIYISEGIYKRFKK